MYNGNASVARAARMAADRLFQTTQNISSPKPPARRRNHPLAAWAIEPLEQRLLFTTLAQYNFNQISGTTATDSSGSGFNATLIGGASFAAGRSGNALTLNGSGYASIANPAALNFTGPITLSAWIKPTSTSGIQDIIDHGYTDNPDAEVYLRINNGSYQVGRWNGTDYNASFAIPASDLNTWVHLSGEYDGSSWRLFRDGVLVAGTPDPGGGAMSVAANWDIGASGSISAGRYFTGQIDDAQIDNAALSHCRSVLCLQTGQIGSHLARGAGQRIVLLGTQCGSEFGFE